MKAIIGGLAAAAGMLLAGCTTHSQQGPAPQASVPAQQWDVTCTITGDSFQIYATNETSTLQETSGWTVVLYDGNQVVGSTATADESVTGGYGALVLQSRFASPGQTVASNFWPLYGITSSPVTSCKAIAP
jgi:acetyl esterase/lipase